MLTLVDSAAALSGNVGRPVLSKLDYNTLLGWMDECKKTILNDLIIQILAQFTLTITLHI
jgi:hypothetical protein